MPPTRPAPRGPEPVALSRAQARRIAIRAQLLDGAEPSGVVRTIEHLTSLQNEPTAAVAPAADLVLYTRLGESYRPDDLQRALESDGTLYELDAMIYPASQLDLRLPEMAAWPPWQSVRDWLEANEPFRRDVLDLLDERGPLATSEIPDTSIVPWQSTGWTHDKNVSQLLGFLSRRGEVAMVGRRGNERLWDLAERVYPITHSDVPLDEARRRLNDLRLRAMGIVRPTSRGTMQEPLSPSIAGMEATVAGVRGRWRVDPELLATADEPLPGRTALLSPFDRLVFDRARMLELFEFDYALEMYKPAAQRRWGYYALPILVGERLVGKLDAASDRAAGVFRVNAVHLEAELTNAQRRSIDHEIERLAAWLGLRPLRA